MIYLIWTVDALITPITEAAEINNTEVYSSIHPAFVIFYINFINFVL